MRRVSVTTLFLVTAVGLWAMSPEVASACERCFGAGADSPMVEAVAASMMLLLVVTTFVFGGAFMFINNVRTRTRAEEEARDKSSSAPETQIDQG